MNTQVHVPHAFANPPHTHPLPCSMFIGGVGWQKRCKTCQSLRELDNLGGTVFCFGGHHDGYRVRSYCAGWRALAPHKGNDRITRCDYGKAPTRQLHGSTHCYIWSGHTKKQSNSSALSSISEKVGTRCRSLLSGGSWKNAVYPSCDSPNNLRRFALGASNVCLIGENPTCSVPA